jgi:hypothetical protein
MHFKHAFQTNAFQTNAFQDMHMRWEFSRLGVLLLRV